MIDKRRIGIGKAFRLHLRDAAVPARGARYLPMVMVGVVPRMVPGMKAAGMPPCAMVRPCGSWTNGDGDGSRTQSQGDETKRPAESK
jgi:hypothetical protein